MIELEDQVVKDLLEAMDEAIETLGQLEESVLGWPDTIACAEARHKLWSAKHKLEETAKEKKE